METLQKKKEPLRKRRELKRRSNSPRWGFPDPRPLIWGMLWNRAPSGGSAPGGQGAGTKVVLVCHRDAVLVEDLPDDSLIYQIPATIVPAQQFSWDHAPSVRNHNDVPFMTRHTQLPAAWFNPNQCFPREFQISQQLSGSGELLPIMNGVTDLCTQAGVNTEGEQGMATQPSYPPLQRASERERERETKTEDRCGVQWGM